MITGFATLDMQGTLLTMAHINALLSDLFREQISFNVQEQITQLIEELIELEDQLEILEAI